MFERAFKEFGLPEAIRTDNGVPFASAHAIYGLSKLAVWWLRLGISERIPPGHPQQNGRHERMHLTLKTEATKPAVDNVLQQQARFDAFVTQYNQERPHQALDMKVPAALYAAHRASIAAWTSSHIRSTTGPSWYRLWPHLFPRPQGQPQPRLRRAERRRDAGRRPHLARHLYAVRFGLFRRRDVPARTDRESVRFETVTHRSE